MADRRKYPRFELKVNAKYNVIDSEDIFSDSKTKNISAEGICFESDTFFKPGTGIGLKIDLGDRSEPVQLTGQIRWSQEVKGEAPGKKKYLNGVKLVKVPESDEGRFLKYYCDRMVEKLSDYLERI